MTRFLKIFTHQIPRRRIPWKVRLCRVMRLKLKSASTMPLKRLLRNGLLRLHRAQAVHQAALQAVHQAAPSSSGSSSSGSSSVIVPSGSGFAWPTPGFVSLSSEWFEDREVYNHGGIDIGRRRHYGNSCCCGCRRYCCCNQQQLYTQLGQELQLRLRRRVTVTMNDQPRGR